MHKISLLTFTRNHVERVFGLIEDLYESVDEIVLIDSSNRDERDKLYSMKKMKKWAKLRIFYTIPLGFVETVRTYGINKCKNDWILYLDCDERASEGIRRDLQKIVGMDYSAFTFRRYEDVTGERTSAFFTFQMRLFRKSKVKYRGIVDERPDVEGRAHYFTEDEYYLQHVLSLMRHDINEYYKPNNIYSKFELLSYQDFNNRMLSYLSRIRGKPENTVMRTRLGWSLGAFLYVYEKLKGKKPGDELSVTDYYLHSLARNIGFALKAKSFGAVLGAFRYSGSYARHIRQLKKEGDHEDAFAISRLISRYGFNGLLHLDNESVIKKLNKEYGDNKRNLEGLALLAHLLEESYSEMKKGGSA